MLPSPATIRWSSSNSLIACFRPCVASRKCSAVSASPSGSGPSAANGGHASSSGASSRSTEPKRRGSFNAKTCSRVASTRWSCLSASSGSIRQRPLMPRWNTSAWSRSVWISPYFARRDRLETVAPVIACTRSGGNGRRMSGRLTRTLTIRSPSRNRARPRTVVSTSGSSGMMTGRVTGSRGGVYSLPSVAASGLSRAPSRPLTARCIQGGREGRLMALQEKCRCA